MHATFIELTQGPSIVELLLVILDNLRSFEVKVLNLLYEFFFFQAYVFADVYHAVRE